MSLTESKTSAVSPDLPWLGVRPFTEDVHEYFFGRNVEVKEVLLGQFYEWCFNSKPPAVCAFVEDPLLSASGFRESTTFDTAPHELTRAGLAHDALKAIPGLVDARLLTSKERGGIRRIELTHGTLSSIARRSRTAREERVEKELAARRTETERRPKRMPKPALAKAAKRAAALNEAA